MAEKKRAPRSAPPIEAPAAGDMPRLRMRIDGGNREEKYDFHFELSQGGECRCGMSSMLRGRSIPDRTSFPDRGELARAIGELTPGLKRAATRLKRSKPKPVPPCSLMGVLELFEGPAPIRVSFMADPGQAEQAGNPVPPEIERAVDAIYGLAAKQLGFESAAEIRP